MMKFIKTAKTATRSGGGLWTSRSGFTELEKGGQRKGGQRVL